MSQYLSTFASPKSNHQPFRYTFSKSPRFSKIQFNCFKSFYTTNTSLLTKRGHKVGKAQRYDFTKRKLNTPAPGFYSVESQFEKDIKGNRGKTFGISRDNSKDQGYLDQSVLRNPGVGKYDNQAKRRTKDCFTMRPKTTSSWLPIRYNAQIDFLQETIPSDLPGPGEYNQTSEPNEYGRSILARYQNTQGQKIGRQKRFRSVQHPTPGPSQYQMPDTFNDSGCFLESKYRGCGKRIISREQRKSFIDQIVENMKEDNQVRNSQLRQKLSQSYIQ